jgi:hypothetical protein
MPFADLKTTEYAGNLRGQPVRVVTPRKQFPDWYAISQAESEHYIGAAGGALVHLSKWFSLAGGHKRSIVWLPRTGIVPPHLGFGFESCDLVLCHHSLGLPWSRWREIRRGLRVSGVGSDSIRLPSVRGPIPTRRDCPLDFGVRSRTMFIVGDAASLAWVADECRSYADSGPGAHFHLREHARLGFRGDLVTFYAGHQDFERATP